MSNPASPFVLNGRVATPSGTPLGVLCEGIGFIGRPIQPESPLQSALVVAAYGALTRTNPVGITLGAGFTRLTNYDQSMPAPLGVVEDTVAGTLTVAKAGVYRVSATIALTLTEQNASTQFLARLFNVTASAPVGDGISFGLGRNTGKFTASMSLLVTVANPAQAIAIEIGGGSTFTGVSIDDAQFAIDSVSALT